MKAPKKWQTKWNMIAFLFQQAPARIAQRVRLEQTVKANFYLMIFAINVHTYGAMANFVVFCELSTNHRTVYPEQVRAFSSSKLHTISRQSLVLFSWGCKHGSTKYFAPYCVVSDINVVDYDKHRFCDVLWWKHSQKGVMDGRTDRRTDRRTEPFIEPLGRS